MRDQLPWKPHRKPFRQLPSLRNPSRSELSQYGETVSADVRLFVWNRDNGRCRSCGSAQELQFDHIIPRAKGGSSNSENVELLCGDCNRRKGTTLFAPTKDDIGTR